MATIDLLWTIRLIIPLKRTECPSIIPLSKGCQGRSALVEIHHHVYGFFQKAPLAAKHVGSTVCLFILFSFLFAGCDLLQRGVTIQGRIANIEDYNVEDAVIQLVHWDLESNDDENKTKVKALYDIGGNMMGMKFESEMPEIKLTPQGKFKYRVDGLKAGRYIVAAQKLIPKNKPNGYFGPGPWIIRPLAKENNRPLVIEVAKNDKPAFSINLEKVFLPFMDSDKYVITDFGEVVVVRP